MLRGVCGRGCRGSEEALVESAGFVAVDDTDAKTELPSGSDKEG